MNDAIAVNNVLQLGWNLVVFVMLICIYSRLMSLEKKLDQMNHEVPKV